MFLWPVFSSNYRFQRLFILMTNTKSRSRTCLTDEHLEWFMRTTIREILNLILNDYSSKTSVKYLTNDLSRKENNCAICESVCNDMPNFLSFLINCHAASIKCPHLQPCGRWLIRKGECGLRSGKRLRTYVIVEIVFVNERLSFNTGHWWIQTRNMLAYQN
jgi:hypothetical protein